jgi:hypothetical protein
MNTKKLLETLGSSNMKTALYTTVILAINMALGTNIGVTGEELNSIFNSQTAISTILIFLLNSGIKIYSAYKVKGSLDFSFLKSTNFVSAVLSILMLIVGSLFNESTSSFILVILTQTINSFLHLNSPVKSEVIK